MIKKFRIRFIVITMTAIVLLLTTIIVTINIINYNSVSSSADEILATLAANGGRFNVQLNPPDDGSTDTSTSSDDANEDSSFIMVLADDTASEGNPDGGYGFDSIVERPYETRYFYVTCTDGEVTSLYMDRIMAVNQEKAIELAVEVFNDTKTKGYKETIYRYLRYEQDENNVMVLFMDNSRRLEPTLNFFFYSIIIASIGVVVSFGIVFLLSKYVVKPLEISNAKQKRFISDAGHELKTPLTIISANNELLEMEYGENEETQIIEKQLARMTEMVKNLSALAKIDEQGDVAFTDVNLSSVLKDTFDTFKTTFINAKKTLAHEIDPDVHVKNNEDAIKKILSILMDNALKYSLTFTKMELKKDGKKIYLTISNDANDIQLGSLDKVFDRFYRSDSARGSTIEGSGIGLSIASQLANGNKIKISAFGSYPSIFNIQLVF